MPSKTEQILSAVETLMAGITEISLDSNGKRRVYRSRKEALDKKELPALVITPLPESAEPLTSCQVLCTLPVAFSIYVDSDAASRVADPIRVKIHSLLFANQYLGGLTIRVRRPTKQPSAVFNDDKGNGHPGSVDLFYEFQFTTLERDLTA